MKTVFNEGKKRKFTEMEGGCTKDNCKVAKWGRTKTRPDQEATPLIEVSPCLAEVSPSPCLTLGLQVLHDQF